MAGESTYHWQFKVFELIFLSTFFVVVSCFASTTYSILLFQISQKSIYNFFNDSSLFFINPASSNSINFFLKILTFCSSFYIFNFGWRSKTDPFCKCSWHIWITLDLIAAIYAVFLEFFMITSKAEGTFIMITKICAAIHTARRTYGHENAAGYTEESHLHMRKITIRGR